MKSIENSISQSIWDKLGISASVVCAVHCLLLPLLLPLLSISGLRFVSEPAFELGLIVFAVAVASYSLTRSYCTAHRQVMPFYFFAAGLALIILSKLLVAESLERFVLPLGALFFAIAHGVNWRLCKSCPSCRHRINNQTEKDKE